MRLLLSNDDGVNAPGIRSLFNELKSLHDTTIIAPTEERSTTGHSLSLDKPLRLEQLEDKVYGCSGFPGDCILMGLGHVQKNNRPELVISGINRGANLGQDLYYSGTIAAAREAAFHQVPSVAVSLVLESIKDPHHYETAAKVIRWCLEMDIQKYCPPLTLININVPNRNLKEIRGCRLTEIGFRKYSEEVHAREDAREREYFWIAGIYEGYHENEKSDCHAISQGFVSVTPHALVGSSSKDQNVLIPFIERMNEKYFT